MIQIETVERMKPGHLIQHYLLASYSYYHHSQSPMTDSAYDRLCARMLGLWVTGAWRNIKHPHKRLITRGDLEAGTCLLQAEDFPMLVRCGADSYAERCIDHTIMKDLEPHLLPAKTTARPTTARTPPRSAIRTVARSAPTQAPQAEPTRTVTRRPIRTRT